MIKQRKQDQHHHHHHDCCDHDHGHHEWHDDTYEQNEIHIHKPEDFEGMRKAGQLAAKTLDFIADYIKPGITTDELDTLCHEFIIQHGAKSAPLGYKGFPKSICTSVNHVVCHGIPGPKKLVEGDIINIDVTPIVDGWHGDTNRTFSVGKISIKAKKLIDVTYEALLRGIEIVKPGAHFGDIGYAIQSFVEKQGFSVVRDFCGHGVGKIFHMKPEVVHFGKPGTGPEMKEGMFFTIEPMVNAGRYEVKVLDDGGTAVTRDKSLSAQFEHSIGVTATGYEIFTKLA
jgi:methionyl aminopeptidase